MTTSERVQAAYQWALNTRQEPRHPSTLRICAASVLHARDCSDTWDQAEQEIQGLIKDWKGRIRKARKEQRPADPGITKAIEQVSRIMLPVDPAAARE